MKYVKLVLFLVIVSFCASCSSSKPTVSSEKQKQIDKDKKGFEKNME